MSLTILRKGATDVITLTLKIDGVVRDLTNITEAILSIRAKDHTTVISYSHLTDPTILTIQAPATAGILEFNRAATDFLYNLSPYEIIVKVIEAGKDSYHPESQIESKQHEDIAVLDTW